MSRTEAEDSDFGHALGNDFDKENSPNNSYARSIELPAEETFRNLRNAKRFAIDIGMCF